MEPSLPPPLTAPPPAPATSLWARLTNVFVVPGEVFTEVRDCRHSLGNWLAPVLISAVVGVVFVFVMFSQETLVHQIREMQEKAIQAKVDAGKIPPEQAKAIMETTERFMSPAFLKITGSIGAVVGTAGWLFGLALYVWLIGAKLFKGRFAFLKAVEVCGLSQMIGVLSAVVTGLLMVTMGHLHATPGPGLLVSNFDPTNKTHLMLAAINLMTFWQIAVLALGMAKLSGASFLKSALWLYVPWAVFKFGMILLGWGSQGF
ncbi:MAG: YIP1 family protein [Verrucomicrobia bacterium]|nr:YIP1 family protein [Verrucomicrobiota bacterium]